MAGIKQIGNKVENKPKKKKQVRKARAKNQDRWFLKHLEKNLGSTKPWTTKGVFYPSMLGNRCDRYLYFAYNGMLPPQKISAQTARIFDVGNSLETRMEKYFERTGLLLAVEQTVRLNSPPISGRYDFLLKHEEHGRIILELKSINVAGFDALIETPKNDHVAQLQIYLNLAGIEHGIVLYENKNDQKLKAFKIVKDSSMWSFIQDRCYKIMGMSSAPYNCEGEFFCSCRGVK